MAISSYLRGKKGRSAIDELARNIHRDRIHGKINMNAKEEKLLIEKARAAYDKEGERGLYKIREKDFERKVLNPLRLDRNDLLERDEVDSIASRYGIEHRTDKADMSDIDD
ncbi:MAG: hypothetical protein V1732_03225 [Patescibacteria group bacterium]|nr:hypothetical protein [Patescibacteria group bacterium]MBU4141330.1 hypothetical protein [Patescibacteria group bacterium]